MSSCNIDHPVEDVQKKLESQQAFLPEELYERTNISQTMRNEIFHLLKKYDLATDEDQKQRNVKLEELLNQV